MTREAAYVALFALLQQMQTAGTVKLASRHAQLLSEVPASDLPAAYLMVDHQPVEQQPGFPAKRTLGAKVLFYADAPDRYTTTGIQLNTLLDAFDDLFKPAPLIGRQTLGDVVHAAVINGEVQVYEGPAGQRGAAIVPVHMIMP